MPSVLTPNIFANPDTFFTPVVVFEASAVFSRAESAASDTFSTFFSTTFTASTALAIGFSRLTDFATPSNKASYCLTIPCCKSKNIDTTIDFLIGLE